MSAIVTMVIIKNTVFTNWMSFFSQKNYRLTVIVWPLLQGFSIYWTICFFKFLHHCYHFKIPLNHWTCFHFNRFCDYCVIYLHHCVCPALHVLCHALHTQSFVSLLSYFLGRDYWWVLSTKHSNKYCLIWLNILYHLFSFSVIPCIFVSFSFFLVDILTYHQSRFNPTY